LFEILNKEDQKVPTPESFFKSSISTLPSVNDRDLIKLFNPSIVEFLLSATLSAVLLFL